MAIITQGISAFSLLGSLEVLGTHSLDNRPSCLGSIGANPQHKWSHMKILLSSWIHGVGVGLLKCYFIRTNLLTVEFSWVLPDCSVDAAGSIVPGELTFSESSDVDGVMVLGVLGGMNAAGVVGRLRVGSLLITSQ